MKRPDTTVLGAKGFYLPGTARESVLALCPNAVCVRRHGVSFVEYIVYVRKGGKRVLAMAANPVYAWMLAHRKLTQRG